MSTVSIVIPAYNSENFIGKTIDSILSQSYPDFTLTIIDDQSTDLTEQVVKSYSDERISFVKNEKNLGLTGNFDHCLDFMKDSLYGLLICNDDIIEKEYLAEKVSIFDRDESVVMVCNATNIINSKGHHLFVRKTLREDILDGKEVVYRSYIKGNIFGEPSGVMFRTSVLNNIAGYDQTLRYALDWEFSIRIAAQGKVVFLKRPLNSFRVSQTSATSNLIKNKKAIGLEHDYLSREIEGILGFTPSRFETTKRKIIFELKFYLRLFVFRVYSFIK